MSNPGLEKQLNDIVAYCIETRNLIENVLAIKIEKLEQRQNPEKYQIIRKEYSCPHCENKLWE